MHEESSFDPYSFTQCTLTQQLFIKDPKCITFVYCELKLEQPNHWQTQTLSLKRFEKEMEVKQAAHQTSFSQRFESTQPVAGVS